MTTARARAQVESVRWAFFLGPDKAGSTWIHGVLARHPDVAVPKSKDLFYFDRFHDRGSKWYLRHFDTRPGTRVCAEVCHDYLFSDGARERIATFAPAADLLVCVRDPVDRAISAYLYMRRQGRVSSPFSDALREVDELVDHARYARHLERWRRSFPLAQLHVLDFAELCADPSAFARRVFGAIGVPAIPLGPDDLVPKREAAAPRSRLLASAGKRTAGLLRRARAEQLLGRLKSSARIEAALFRPLHRDERPQPSAEDRAYLRAELEEDARRLDDLLGSAYVEAWWDPT